MPDIAVVGAGPFGLSVAAHLGERARVFGAPLETWRTRMPPDMLLRSAWDETSLSAPQGRGTIDEWAAATGAAREEPLALQTFLRYADWFRSTFVVDHDVSDVVSIAPSGERFVVTAESGASAEFTAIVIAVGVTPFPYAPPALAPALGQGASFAIDMRDPERYRGASVLVVGAGQAGLETAGILARAGADVEVVTRSEVRWFADREPHHERSALGRRLYRLAYPAVGYGPPPLNRLVLYPDLYAALPPRIRRKLTARLLRPGGSPWVRSLVEGRVALTEGVAPTAVSHEGDRVRVALSDGRTLARSTTS